MVDAALQVLGRRECQRSPHEGRPGETVEFRILRRDSRVKNILDFRRADFGLFQRSICLEEPHGSRP